MLVTHFPKNSLMELTCSTFNIIIFCFSEVVVQFAPTSYGIRENEGMVTFMIERIGQASGITTVLFSTEDDSALGERTATYVGQRARETAIVGSRI